LEQVVDIVTVYQISEIIGKLIFKGDAMLEFLDGWGWRLARWGAALLFFVAFLYTLQHLWQWVGSN
jgi:hypothetical protein